MAAPPLRNVQAAFYRALRGDTEPPGASPPVLAEPCPCDGCPRAPRCARELLACTAFAMFYHGRPWSVAARVDASGERYVALGLMS